MNKFNSSAALASTGGFAATRETSKIAALMAGVICVCLGLAVLSAPAQPTYTVTNLGTPASGTDSEAHAVNRSGSVAGIWWTLTSDGDGFLYGGGTNADLGTIGSGKYSDALAINDSNLVVGQSSTSGGVKPDYHAFLYTNNTLVDLGALGNSSWSSANTINKSGLIAGESIVANGNIHAATFQGGIIHDLGTLPSGDYSTALGINDAGVIVGESTMIPTPGITNTLAFMYSNNVMTSLGTLGSGTYSLATAINNSGQIVGESANSNGQTHAFLWKNGVMTDLGTFGGTYSKATAINNFGQVVGYATDASENSHAFLYIGTNLVNLDNAAVPGSAFSSLGYAYGINDAGQITGAGNTTNHYLSFLLTPVPSPLSINCSSNLTVTATSSNGTAVFFTVTAGGGCYPPPTLVSSPASGSFFPIGTTTVTNTATDLCGNSTNCSFTVTVVRPPLSINCSTNITVTATSSNGAAVFFTVTGSGSCSPVTVVSIPASGSTFPIGTTTVTNTASDACGGSTNCSFTVTVVRPPLSINCPSNITTIVTGSNGAVVNFTVTASGGCSSPTVASSPTNGSTFPIGITTVTNTATDACGGSTNCSFTVTVYPALALSAPTVLANGQFQVTVGGAPGERFAVQTSSNLTSWIGLNTNTLVSNAFHWTDTVAATNNRRFYRALALP